MKVFGIGLSKSGTTSLDAALNMLGLRSIHYPDPESMVAGRFDVLEGYAAATDIPVAAYFRELDAAFAGSRFVLTVRELPGWLQSVEYHFAAREPGQFLGDSPRGIVRERVYGTRFFERGAFTAAYHRWHDEVRRHFEGRPRDLLVMNICAGEGWERLCPFLGVPIPAAPFPHEHRRATAQSGAG